MAVARELSALTLNDLHSVQEFAMWAKAKSMLEEYEEALKGYEKALAECDCDPALLLDYGVALHAAGKKEAALARLKLAYEHLARATDPETRRNVYKSLTFELLHEPRNFDHVIKLVDEYEQNKDKTADQSSGGLLVNKACAWGQKFKWIAKQSDLIEDVSPLPIKVTLAGTPPNWVTTHPELKKAYDEALKAVKRAIEVDPTWKKHLQLLLKRGDSVKSDRPDIEALEVFERFDDFRLVLELPPFSEATKEQKIDKPVEETEQKDQGDPGDDVSTETNKGTKGISGESP
jgi:tetratricopeptide (TPR) repeat protein